MPTMISSILLWVYAPIVPVPKFGRNLKLVGCVGGTIIFMIDQNIHTSSVIDDQRVEQQLKHNNTEYNFSSTNSSITK